MRPNISVFTSRSQFGAFSPNDSIQSNSNDPLSHAVGDHLKAHVWKLQDVSVDNEDGESQEGYGSPGLSPINTFTLQETLFVEQLTSIDERVRLQVSNFECSYDVIVGSVTSSGNDNLHSSILS